MPVTTRYSATFDRTYEEDPSPTAPTARRSRSQSWQANSGLDGGGPYTPLGGRPPAQRSSSTDNGSSKGPEHIPTRTVVKTAVKAHNNPFQFVKVGTCPLYKKAEEQLKKAKDVKKPDVLKEEEEEWQSNLDSWKSRRRKMSEDVFRRAEEVRQFEIEEQSSQVSQKKTKTFSEMVEQRATRGRALSLCLISSPMELQNWEFDGSHKNGSCSTFSGESEENSTVNSEDEGVSLKGTLEKSENGTHNNHRTNGDAHIVKNGSDTHNGDYSKLSGLENNLQIKPKEGSYIDSGLESISSHRAGDTPDSGSDFSHDSGSSMDCESPRAGVNILEEFKSKSSQISSAQSTTSDTANGLDDVGKKSEIAVKANKSEVLSPKTESLQYERSIESENEMFVDDYEELQRQSELLAASSKSKAHAENANSQKVNTPAKQIEECKNLNVDSLNIVFQSEPKHINSENQSNVKNSEIPNSVKDNINLVPDVPPVEKVAEEMEKLILEQLEEEERAKELASGLQIKSLLDSSEHLLTAPPKLAEPPKEKPPPPPANEGNQKETSLKRVNSTKRIKKEIYKRRSNFLGIDNADENLACNESSIPPPPALEEILKAEMELDRQGRLKIESEATERLTQEEKEIMQKEREIIESLESEERQKQLINCSEDFSDIAPNNTNDVISEEERILLLKNERKRLEAERLVSEEQQLHIIEEKQLKEREEFIRKQEGVKSAVPHSDNSLSVAVNVPNTLQSSLPPLSTDSQSSQSLPSTLGDGISLTSISAPEISKKSESSDRGKIPQKPIVPPKPLKKKEAIRKERERLRQEQETLQREREEHRCKLMQEQEELLKQKSHAPEASVSSQLGPFPPLVPLPLTTAPQARDSASFSSRSHHGAPNGAAGNNNSAELMGPAVVRQKIPPPRKVVQNEAWGQQKIPSVRKQNQDSLTESRYNQNHWLIQEAEMCRIAELKERQRTIQLPCSQTHLAEDDVCSNSPRIPVIPPSNNQHMNYHAVQDKMWNYASQSNVPIKQYPPPVVKEPLHTIYPRDNVSQQPPMKPSRVVPMERQEQMLSVSGRKRCSHCSEELGRGAAMIIESLQLYYHINCFQCCVCHAQLGNGSCGTDVRVRNQKLHCHNCYSNDEAGLKFSQV